MDELCEHSVDAICSIVDLYSCVCVCVLSAVWSSVSVLFVRDRECDPAVQYITHIQFCGSYQQ